MQSTDGTALYSVQPAYACIVAAAYPCLSQATVRLLLKRTGALIHCTYEVLFRMYFRKTDRCT